MRSDKEGAASLAESRPTHGIHHTGMLKNKILIRNKNQEIKLVAFDGENIVPTQNIKLSGRRGLIGVANNQKFSVIRLSPGCAGDGNS